MTVIRTHNLCKTFRIQIKAEGFRASLKNLIKPSYRSVSAVQELSFEVEAGEAVAFLGPNGAGKSTTIKMLTGILQADDGEIAVLGLDPRRQRTELAFSVGSVFGQKSQLWYHLPAADSFRLLGAIYELQPAALKHRKAELTERFGLADLLDVPVRKLSLGQRIRLEIAASLLHRPRLLFLDEPTIGLDVVVKQEIRTLLETWNRDEKVTLFLTSHDLGDVEKLCRRAILINHGTIMLDEPLKNLKHQSAAKKIVGVRYHQPTHIQVPDLHPSKCTADAARFEVDTKLHHIEDIMRHLVGLGAVADLTVEDEPLENLIADLYRSQGLSGGKSSASGAP